MTDPSIVEQVESLKHLLMAQATGGYPDAAEYAALRHQLLAEPYIRDRLPAFVRTCSSLLEFWGYIQPKYAHYRERREHLAEEFAPLIQALIDRQTAPLDSLVSSQVARVDTPYIQQLWQKALDRRATDFDGAVTAARTMLESVCKLILDTKGITYIPTSDLPHLYDKAVKSLSLAASQQTERCLKQILGGCCSVVLGVGTLRNLLSDAHGKGKQPEFVSSDYAALAVNLSGAVAFFLLARIADESGAITEQELEAMFPGWAITAQST
ncbi:MAG TPA: abortive infection family protein [Armatimonadota bacterium]|nr:abortive infection family protein [Armatimonadota bacterium]